MGEGVFVKLRCQQGTLDALSRGLTQFGAATGDPQWLVSGVWLCTSEAQYLASASVEVLPDGFVARSLCVTTPEDFSSHVQSELPDLGARLRTRGRALDVPLASPVPTARSLQKWPSDTCSMSILVRASQRERGINRIACALLFASDEGYVLLVGTDPGTLAMVLSEDKELIERYCDGCDRVSLGEYLELAGT